MPIDVLLRYALIFLIGPLLEIAAKAWDKNRPKVGFPVSGAALGVVLCIGWYFVSGAGGAAAGAGGSNSGDAISISMSLIGLVIAIVTGLTVTSAWRAIDETAKAGSSVAALSRTLDERLALTEFEVLRVAAFIEAVERHHSLREVGDFRDRLVMRAEIIPLFSEDDPKAILRRAMEIQSNEELTQEIGPQGRRLLDALAKRPHLTEPERRALYMILSRPAGS